LIHEGALGLVLDGETRRLRFVLPTGEAVGDQPQLTIEDIATHSAVDVEWKAGMISPREVRVVSAST
jgi:hypothetical protein